MKPIDAPSPNFDVRTLPISMIVLHYTGMQDAASAIARLRDPEAKVSAHYVVDEDGTVLRLVDEANRAWVRRVDEALAPFRTGRYVGEADLTASPHRRAECFTPDALQRLETLRRRYDPDGVFAVWP